MTLPNFNPNDEGYILNVESASSTGRTYLQNLAYISKDAADVPVTFGLLTGDSSVIEALIEEVRLNSRTSAKSNPSAAIEAFFSQFNILEGKPVPNSWPAFIKAFYDFCGVREKVGTKLVEIDPEKENSPFAEFRDMFRRMSGFYTDLGEQGSVGSGIIDFDSVDFNAQFQAAFATFIRTLPYDAFTGKIAGAYPSSTANFFFLFNQFLQPLTTTTNESQILAVDSLTDDYTIAGGATPPAEWIAQYDQFYTYFVEDVTSGTATTAAKNRFKAEFTDFYNDTVKKYGYFHPGHALDGWVSRMWKKFQNAKLPTIYSILDDKGTELDTSDDFRVEVNVVTSVSSVHSKRVIILDRIFRLLAQMIGSLQQVAAAQAQQITFLSNWQRVFTDMITQIETFTRGDQSIFGLTAASGSTDDNTLTTERGEANQAQVTRRETLSAWRGIVQDTAKREQTRVNQSQDAVSQQANIASSIIQQLTTILGTIFR